MKDQEMHGMALEEALEVWLPETHEALRETSTTHVSSTSVDEGKASCRPRRDVDGAARTRNLIHPPRKPLPLCTFFSDGSPVTGTEVQGMMLQIIMLTGIAHDFLLPGMALQYGYCRCIDKTVAFLWALWLVSGPGEKLMRCIINVSLAPARRPPRKYHF